MEYSFDSYVYVVLQAIGKRGAGTEAQLADKRLLLASIL
jgi:hypothetical protein